MKQTIIFIASLAIMTLTNSCKSQKESNAKNPSVSERSTQPRGGHDRKGPPSADEVFKMDANGDGMLAKSEIKGRLLKKFDMIDANKDGLISRAEFENAPRLERGQKSPRKQ